jgi:hypothetical protein
LEALLFPALGDGSVERNQARHELVQVLDLAQGESWKIELKVRGDS